MSSRLRALDNPVSRLSGVGPRVAERLARLKIETIRDLVFHLPIRYQDRTRRIPIGSLRAHTEVVIEGIIESAQVQYGRRRSLLCCMTDGTGAVHLRFFHFSRAQQNRLSPGQALRCFGEVRRGPNRAELVHPECQFFDAQSPPPMDTVLTPIYSTTDGIHQIRLRKLTEQALTVLRRESEQDPIAEEMIPARVLSDLKLPGLTAALLYVHRPPPDAPVDKLVDGTHPTQQRLAFEELLAHHLSLKRMRCRTQVRRAPRFPGASRLRQRLLDSFGFALTAAQQRAIEEIDRDLGEPRPMMRLLQGDVGSGKTAVAAAVAAAALSSGYQTAVMAPTELLAEQHTRNFTAWFEPLGIKVCPLTGRLPQSVRKATMQAIASGQPLLISGTHALFQEGVEYPKLGLVIVDEQHRFGVHQRLALRDKGARDDYSAHQLIMTATPIPRTLAMTAYADLDVSVLDELPPGRQPVRTAVIPEIRRHEIIERVAHACAEKRQIYWVCPLIDESELIQAQAATDTADKLTDALPNVRIGLVHGRVTDNQKEATMLDFADHRIDLLVATTVIEVGVDIANASLMVVENAERLGLSQLHQLRGRVGRGSANADCLLLYKGPLSETAKRRLQVMRETNDGFVISERDLELRGPGEVLGTRQTGVCEFKIADLMRDSGLLPAVSKTASELLNSDPKRVDAIINRWLGHRIEYGNV